MKQCPLDVKHRLLVGKHRLLYGKRQLLDVQHCSPKVKHSLLNDKQGMLYVQKYLLGIQRHSLGIQQKPLAVLGVSLHTEHISQIVEEQKMGLMTSLAQQLTDARLMAEGLKKRADALATVGITAETTANIEALTEKLATLDNEQEGLKAALKTKTAELTAVQKELKEAVSGAKKRVKLVIDQTDWLTFGISDKK